MNTDDKLKDNNRSSVLDCENMQTDLLSVKDILSDDHYFRIPDFQRGYAWGEKEFKDLWNDVLRIYRTDKNRKHYTGMLSLEKIKDNNLLSNESLNNTTSFYIVDGQQRITTVIIFISFLLDYLSAYNSDYDLNDYKYLIKSQKDIFRFGYSCSRKDNTAEFFEKRIYAKNKDCDHTNQYLSNLDLCANFIEEELKRYDSDEVLIILDLIINNLIFNIYLVDEFDVRLTFETMNNRGKHLSSLELLKNRLLYLSTFFVDANQSSLLKKKINNVWKNIYDNLCLKTMQLADDDYLKAHWIVYHGIDKNKGSNFVSEILDNEFAIDIGRFFDVFQTDMSKAYRLIMDYIDSLNRHSLYWAVVNTNDDVTDFKSDKAEIDWIKRLVRLSNNLFLRTALMVIIADQEMRLYLDKKEEFYKKIEQFVFINKYLSQDRNDLSFLISVAKDFLAAVKGQKLQMFKKIVAQVEQHELAIKSDQCEKIINNFSNYLNNKKNKKYFFDWNGLTYFLYQYNYSLNLPVGMPVEWNKINSMSIEHILPQDTKFEYWKVAFQGYLDDEEAKARITNALGNLLLLSSGAENSSLSNHSFPVKKDMSVESGKFAYKYGSRAAQKVAESEHWTPNEIYNRSHELLKFMYCEWFQSIHGFTEEMWWDLIKKYNLMNFDIKQCNQKHLKNMLDKIDCSNERKQVEEQAVCKNDKVELINNAFKSFFPIGGIGLKRNSKNVSYKKNLYSYVLEVDDNFDLKSIKCGVDVGGHLWINYNCSENRISVWTSNADIKVKSKKEQENYIRSLKRFIKQYLMKDEPSIEYSND